MLAVCSQVCWAESLGDLSLQEIVVKPDFVLKEPSEGAFSLGDTSLSAQWEKGENFQAIFRIGSKSQIGQPLFYSDSLDSELGIFEAYGQFDGVYGRLQMGLIPLQYSIEGREGESSLALPRSMIYKNRWIGLRDLGFSYLTEFNGYFTRLAVHNGEGGVAIDHKTWVTMNWGWSDEKYFEWMISAHTGRTDEVSMKGSITGLAGVDRTDLALWRIGGISIDWHPNRWSGSLEFHYGELEQSSRINKFVSGHFDLGYFFTDWFQSLIRWDQMEPNGNVQEDQVTEVSLGLAFHGPHSNSVFTVVATHVSEEGNEVVNDRLMFQWKLTPLSR